MQSLYALTNEFQQLIEIDADNDADFAEALATTLDVNSSQIEDKIEATIIVARQLDAEVEAHDAEIKRLTARKKTLERNAQACRDRVLWAMENTGRDKIKRQLFTITRAKPRAVCSIEHPDRVPEQYTKLIPASRQPVKAEILKALQAGENVPGCKLADGKASLRVS
ncbi:siphovirus Gp157 family protein [Vreelandella populi]|uniref:siphovirus Gp157 family protein n=1 Tax=Vreelandella populi TaxID=2498858 RepID=UPI000F8CBF56|nr:siphovirus Gp157 family protein [Halomonas populi]RUR38504.1 siphovirus Gp157 family protein [Halomonas populi]